MEKISIVVPVYNAARFLPETIRSVQNQTYTEWELIPVDDVSTDNSLQVIEEAAAQDTRIRPVALSENGGAAKARNAGTKLATGRYLAFLDADDVWTPDKLERTLAYMQEKEATFVFTGYEFADESAVGTGKIVQVPETITYKEALGNTTIFTSTVMLDLQKIERELAIMPLVKSEDTATWWQILRSGITGYGLNENLVMYRRSANTLSSNKVEAVKRIWYLYRKVEKLNLLLSSWYFLKYAVRAVMRRI